MVLNESKSKEYDSIAKDKYRILINIVMQEYDLKFKQAKKYLMDKYHVKQGKIKTGIKRVKREVIKTSIDVYKNDLFNRSLKDLSISMKRKGYDYQKSIMKNTGYTGTKSSMKVWIRENEYKEKIDRLYNENVFHYMTLNENIINNNFKELDV